METWFVVSKDFYQPQRAVLLRYRFGGTTQLADSRTGKILHKFSTITSYDVAFSADESYLAIATQDQGVLVYRIHNI